MKCLGGGESYREVLANRSFRALWLAQAMANLGRAIVYVAVALYVYELTGSARELSFAVALELLPWVLIAPLAGMLADHLERKGVLVVAYFLQAAVVVFLPFASTLGQIYLLVFVSGLLVPVVVIVRAAALPAVLGSKLFVRGSSLNIVAYNAVNVIGPALGGWLVSLMGARQVFFIAVGCYLGSTLVASRATVPSPTAEESAAPGLRMAWSDLRRGMGFLLRTPLLRYTLILDCIASLGWSPPDMALLVYLNEQLGLGGREYGLLRATMSLSLALGVYVLGRYASHLARWRLLAGGVIAAGLVYTLASLRPGLLPLLLLWFAGGLAWSANWLIDNTVWAEATPDAIRGRVYSLAEATVAIAEVGTALVGGELINLLGPLRALALMGGSIAAGAIGVSLLACLRGDLWPAERL